MATGVGCGTICLTSFSSPTPKTPLVGATISLISLIQAEVYPIQFHLRFHCYSNQGRSP